MSCLKPLALLFFMTTGEGVKNSGAVRETLSEGKEIIVPLCVNSV